MKNDYKTIFFDWNNTLSRSLFWEQLESKNHPRHKWSKKISKFLFEKNKDLINPWMRGDYNLDYIVEFISTGITLPKKLLKKDLEESCRNMKFVSNKVIDYISILKNKGIQCVIATDNMDTFAKYTIPGMKLDKIFDDFLISCELHTLKFDINKKIKSTPFFDEYLKKNKLHYKDVVLIDDCVDDGTFKKFGFNIVQVKNKCQLLKTLKSLVVP